MERRIRQYTGLIGAVVLYYLVHEGAHFLYAVCVGAFKTIHFTGIGMQVDIFRERMSDVQLGLFCLAGPASTLLFSVLMTACTKKICAFRNPWIRTLGWYSTLAILLIDPVYMTVLYRFAGGGDMNGIRLILPEIGVNLFEGLLLAAGLYGIAKKILPAYTESFRRNL